MSISRVIWPSRLLSNRVGKHIVFSVENVGKRYGTSTALKDVSLRFEEAGHGHGADRRQRFRQIDTAANADRSRLAGRRPGHDRGQAAAAGRAPAAAPPRRLCHPGWGPVSASDGARQSCAAAAIPGLGRRADRYARRRTGAADAASRGNLAPLSGGTVRWATPARRGDARLDDRSGRPAARRAPGRAGSGGAIRFAGAVAAGVPRHSTAPWCW